MSNDQQVAEVQKPENEQTSEVQNDVDSRFTIEGDEYKQEESTKSLNDDNSAESTDSGQEEKPVISPEAQSIIAEKAFKEREAKRETEELRKKLDEYEKNDSSKEPIIPKIPDRWDYDDTDEYNLAVENYADKKAELKLFQQKQEQTQQQEQLDIQTKQQEHAQQLNGIIHSYNDKAKDLGINIAELQKAGDVIQAYGLKSDAVMAILNDSEGPLITKYLAANPQAIDALNSSTWLNGQEIFNKVKESAAVLKPKTNSAAPPPVDRIDGGAISKDDNPWGAKIE